MKTAALQVDVATYGDRTPSVRVQARDWPWAPAVGILLVTPGAALLGWAMMEGRFVEAGGAVVFVGIGVFCLALGLRNRRDLVVSHTDEGIRVAGVEGMGPWSRATDVLLSEDAHVAVEDFPEAGGAPPVSVRGGDLVLRDGATSVRLARGVGPRGRALLDAAAATIRATVGPPS